ncbi:MAG TPA: family 10 glycosylhydrolase [Kiritimatiellia bacterium]|nr:family 10 glycosylhydrolase [Kiritimatiellia bacterium]
MAGLRLLVPSLAVLGLILPAAGAARPVVDLHPDVFVAGESSLPPHAVPDGGVMFSVPFSTGPDRVYWDAPVRSLPPAAAIEIEVTCDEPAAIRALSLHLQAGGQWASAQKTIAGPGRQTLLFRRSDFDEDPWPPNGHRPATLRLSAWKGANRDARLGLFGIRTRTFSIAVVQGSDSGTAPGEAALAEQCAGRALELLDRAGLPAGLVSDDLETLDLRPFRLLVLPYNPRLSSGQIRALERFVKRRKGILAVFYNANADLAHLLGFQAPAYVTAPAAWTTVAFDEQVVPGLPAAMAHRTQHLLPARAKAKSAIELGVWLEPDHPSGDRLPASVVSSSGIWFSHVPPFASPSAVQWFLAALARANHAYARDRDRHRAELDQRNTQAAEILRQQPAPSNEFRAVWAHPIPAHSRPETFRRLADHGIHAVFEHMATGGHLLDGARDKPLTQALADARAAGIQLHAWCIAWSLHDLPARRTAAIPTRRRLMQDSQGNELPWLCPSRTENRQLLVALYADLARRGVAGIHLDYARYPARDGCYCPATRAAFEDRIGRAVTSWPAEVLPGAPLAAEFDQFRHDEMTTFVAEATAAVRAVDPAIRCSAAVFPLPEAIDHHGQNWPAWLRSGHLDFVAPMLYEPTASRFADRLERCLAAAPAPGKILPGIGLSADTTQLDALAAAEQIQAVRTRQTAGFAVFHLDANLERILPTLPAPPP